LAVESAHEGANAVREETAGDEVEVVGHEAVGVDFDLACGGVAVEEFEEGEMVAVASEAGFRQEASPPTVQTPSPAASFTL
jgi:hypothetical protein